MVLRMEKKKVAPPPARSVTPRDVSLGLTHAEDVAFPLRWGIIGGGEISRQFVCSSRECAGATIAAVATRSEDTANAFAASNAPARHVVIEAMGHLGPSDICAIGENGGGPVQIALDQGLPIPDNLVRLGTDGCQPGALPPPDGWPVINHFVTAQLRWAFGFDEDPVGLSQDVADDFPEATITYEESL